MIKEVRYDEVHDVSRKDVAPEPGEDSRFRVGDVVRTVGGGGSYNRAEVAEIAEEKHRSRARAPAPTPGVAG